MHCGSASSYHHVMACNSLRVAGNVFFRATYLIPFVFLPILVRGCVQFVFPPLSAASRQDLAAVSLPLRLSGRGPRPSGASWFRWFELLSEHHGFCQHSPSGKVFPSNQIEQPCWPQCRSFSQARPGSTVGAARCSWCSIR